MTVGADLAGSVSIGSAIVAALVALLGVLGYQSRRSRLSAIRTAFSDVVAGLASDETEQRLAAAVLLRRFFDPESELGVRDVLWRRRAPYQEEALGVIAAVLRGQPTGDLQKLLADGLAHAPTLAGADLQRANLERAYLSLRQPKASMEGTDFYRADLSGASLKGGRAKGAVFYEARLRGTVFARADLRDTNFFGADLTGAVFTGARLEGANFGGAMNVPVELEPFLNAEGRYTSDAPAPEPAREPTSRRGVFVSMPSRRSASQDALCDWVLRIIRQANLVPVHLPRKDYPATNAMSEIYRRVAGCCGAVVFGLRPEEETVAVSAGASPWTHLEAGMAYACSLPLLIVREPGVDAGAFAEATAGYNTFVLDASAMSDPDVLSQAMSPWLAEVGNTLP